MLGKAVCRFEMLVVLREGRVEAMVEAVREKRGKTPN